MARLGQVIKKLNIGIETAAEYLNKKGEEIQGTPSTKLTEQQEALLFEEFSSDKSLKEKSEKLLQERLVKDNTTIDIEQKPKTKKRKEAEVVKAKVQQEPIKPQENNVVEREEENPIVPEEPKTIAQEEPKIIAQEEPKIIAQEEPKIIAQEEPTFPTKVIPQKEEVVVVKETEVKIEPIEETQSKDNTPDHSDDDRLTIKSPKVVGTIDLSQIGKDSRPKPKSKEDRKKERKELDKKRREEEKKLKEQRKKSSKGDKSHNKSNDDNKNDGDNNSKGKDRFIKTDVPTLKGPKIIDKVELEPEKPFDNKGKTKDNDRGDRSYLKDKKKRDRIRAERIDMTEDGKKSFKSSSRKDRRSKRAVIDVDDVNQNVRETLAIARGGRKFNKKAVDYRKEKRDNIRQEMERQAEIQEAQSKVLKLTEFVTANELASMMNVPVNDVIKVYMSLGMFVAINQRLDAESINIVADEFGFETEFVSADATKVIAEEIEDNPEDLVPRPPIITVMGHVDHGKTSLLDYIRDTNVIAGEAGGITQHIGAYNVKLEDGRQITFLDTPGHEAFTAMRARGAKVTDIAIIIVAADDDVMPQTVEAINHASSAGVPIVFAINKVDKDGADPDRIKTTLANMNYMVEAWGGKYQSQDISAKHGQGVSELLDKVLLESEMLDLKANPNRNAMGSVIEVRKDKGRGNVVTLLVENGTLKQGDIIMAGYAYGRVRAMFNERNQSIKQAKPSEPVLILGMKGELQAGDKFNVMDTEQAAREIISQRDQLKREQKLRTSRHLTLDEIGRRIAMGNFQELNLIVKGDVDGSIEALSDTLIKLSTPEMQVNVIHKGVGQITEGDVNLAISSNAIIIGFQVRPTTSAKHLAEAEEVDIRTYSIIYQAVDEVKAAMEGMLIPDKAEKVLATLEVRDTFHISKIGVIAGCIVKDGVIKRGNKIRVIHDGIVVHTGDIASLKHEKDDVKEVKQGYECGVNVANFSNIVVGDVIESFEEIEIKKTLD